MSISARNAIYHANRLFQFGVQGLHIKQAGISLDFVLVDALIRLQLQKFLTSPAWWRSSTSGLFGHIFLRNHVLRNNFLTKNVSIFHLSFEKPSNRITLQRGL